MEGCVMNDPTERAPIEDAGRFLSQSERRLADFLSHNLHAPLVWEPVAPALQVDTAGGTIFKYQPDFVIRDVDTGRTLFVELQSVQALSLSNLVKFKFVSDAAKRAGGEFLLLVEGDADAAAIQRSLASQGVRAVRLGERGEAETISAIQTAIKPPA
jgi:hypothetical protein